MWNSVSGVRFWRYKTLIKWSTSIDLQNKWSLSKNPLHCDNSLELFLITDEENTINIKFNKTEKYTCLGKYSRVSWTLNFKLDLDLS